ncbi:uncharacterized protein LOC121137488 isoform X1 [Mesocricetus auratus]|uniref:Uncharacterized protein LOC121137488 isoform X1 n=1 Tax=Mesocricetus auratus TaxID=10036 RepID=A0ABM2X4B7_MESAU|nr:uncharacterized protein LOC121137488 isoform X1 [Mesocricetus auratus]
MYQLVEVEPIKPRRGNILDRPYPKHSTILEVDEESQDQDDTSIERPQIETEVSPEPAKIATSPRFQRKPPMKMVKVVSKKRRFVSKIWRKLFRNSTVFPRDTEEPQVQDGTSNEGAQSEMEVSPEPAKIATSPRFQRKPLMRMVKVASRKCMYGSNTLRQMCWRCPVVCKASASIERPRNEMEVSPENSDSPDSPVGQQKPQGRTEKMISKKRRCVRAMVNEMYQKQHMVPLNEDKPQDIAGTSRKTEDIKTKGTEGIQ